MKRWFVSCTLYVVMLVLSTLLADNVKVARDGGYVKTRGRGYISVVDCRAQPGAEYVDGVRRFENGHGVEVRMSHAGSFAMASAMELLRVSGANAAVFVVDEPSLPIALLAGEERWALVNAAKARIDKPDGALLARRMSALVFRQLARVISTDESTERDNCFFKVLSPSDLDGIRAYDFPAGAYVSMHTSMERLGIEQIELVTYREACEMGVAALPTNDVQKAIWDKVHTIPKTPMKIEFDPKKGR